MLDVIRDEGLQQNALDVGTYFKLGLEELKERYDLVGDVRGEGLFLGIELVRDVEQLTPATDEAHLIAEQMKKGEILVSVDGILHNVIKIKPPLVFNKKNVDFYISTLENILKKIN